MEERVGSTDAWGCMEEGAGHKMPLLPFGFCFSPLRAGETYPRVYIISSLVR